MVIVSSALLRYTDSDYPFGIFWSLCCQFFFDIHILITPLVSCGHCVVSSSSIYGFWLPFWYPLAIVLSVLLRYTDFDYPFGIFWPLHCQFFFDIRILITPLVSCGHCVVCSSSIYRFWLPFWYLLAIVSSALLRYTDSDYPLVSCGHCVVCSSSIYRFWLPLWYLLAIMLSVLLRYTDSDYPFGIIWPLCCQFFFDIQILITLLVSFGHCVVSSSSIYRFWLPFWYLLAIVLSDLLRYTDADYPFGIFWPLCCQFFFDIRILIIPLVSCGHCVVSSSSIYRFWLPLWYLLVIVLSVLLWYTDSDYPFGILRPLRCQFFFDIRFWLLLWYLLAIVLSVLLRYADLDYPSVYCDHCVVCSSSIYRFWLPLWYRLAIVSSALLRYRDSEYPFGIFWPPCCQFFFDIRILITPFVSFCHCVVCSSSIYRFWLPLWYLLAIVFSVLLRYTESDYPFGIFWPLCCQFFFDIQILITP